MSFKNNHSRDDHIISKPIKELVHSNINRDSQTSYLENKNIETLSKPLLLEQEHEDKIQNESLGVIKSSHLNVKRLAYTLPQFNEKYEAIKDVKRRSVSIKSFDWIKHSFSSQSLMTRLNKFLPIIGWLGVYSIRHNLIADLIAGLTVLVFQVPQSMGYSLIARVPPVYGLYSSFFPCLIYCFFGTSKHCAIGTFAIISLMTGSLISQVLEKKVGATETNITSIEVAMIVSFLIGIYQLIFGILRLGFFSVYMSEQLVSGFTTACSIYVFSSQLCYLVGLHLTPQSGPLSLITSYKNLIKKYDEFSTPTVILSMVCCLVMIVFKFLINPLIRKKFKLNVTFPIELLLVIFGTLASHILNMESRWNIQVVGTIPKGLPQPFLPRLDLFRELAIPSIPLAIVAFTLTVSVGKIFASKHNYKIDANQELVALGTSNLISSFFSCIPSAASLSRTAVQESSGGQTQIVSIVNCIGLFFIILFAGPLLSKMPNCILSSIIIISLKSLLFQAKNFPLYWRLSKLDGGIWLITFFSVILLDVEIGLYISLCYSLLTLIYKSQRPKIYLLGCVNNTDVYVPLHKYAAANEINGIKIYQFCGPLHFANIEYFKKGLIRKTGVCVKEILLEQEKLRKGSILKREMSEKIVIGSKKQSSEIFKSFKFSNPAPSHIIIDCSMFSYIDATGVRQLKKTISEYENIGIKTFLACVATHVHKMLEKDGFFIDIPPNHVYITIHDAVHHIVDQQNSLKKQIQQLSTIKSCHSSKLFSCSKNEDQEIEKDFNRKIDF